MDLNEFSTFDLLGMLTNGYNSPFERVAGKEEIQCRVWTSHWVPDGLSLQGYPDVAYRLHDLEDYPNFSVSFPCPIRSDIQGLEALEYATQLLKRAADEIRARTQAVDAELQEIRALLSAPAKPWHLVDLDHHSQVVRTTQSKLRICFNSMKSKEYLDCADVSRYVCRGAGHNAETMRWKGAYVDQIERGGHSLRIMRPRLKPIVVDLLPVSSQLPASDASTEA